MDVLFDNKNKWITDTRTNMDENQNHSGWKKPDTQNMYWMSPFYKLLENANSSMVTKSVAVAAWGNRTEMSGMKGVYKGIRKSGSENVQYFDCYVGFTGVCICQASQIVYFK